MALLVLDTAFFLLEIIIGYAVHSLALVADAFHMLNDMFSLVVALWAVRVAKSRGADAKYTYGWQRAEILGALINGVFLVALCLTIFLEAIQRFLDPPVISNPVLILVVGSAGLVSNIIGLLLFHEHDHGHGHGHSHGGGGGGGDIGHSHVHSHAPGALEALIEEERARPHHNTATYGTSPIHSRGSPQSVTEALPETVVQDIADERTRLLGEACNPAMRPRSQSALSATHSNHYHHLNKLAANSSSPAKKKRSLNMEGVFLHVLGDALGNIGVIITALMIWKTDFSWKYYLDPAISLVITCIILTTAIPLCRRASAILLQAVPQSVDAEEVKADLSSLPGVVDVHDLHIWILAEDLYISTLHVSVACDEDEFMHLAQKINACLHGHGIHSNTIQPEFISRTEASYRSASSSDGEGTSPRCAHPCLKPTGGLHASSSRPDLLDNSSNP